MIHEDEILLMVAKNNGEAIELLFSFYEKKMRYEANNFAKKYNTYMRIDDLLQEMKVFFLSILPNYDFRKGKLYTFWLSTFKYQLFTFIDKNASNLVMFDSYLESEYVLNNIDENQMYESDVYDNLENLKDDKEKIYNILVAWNQGYKYEEIAKMYHTTVSVINYYMKKGIEIIKKKVN